MKTNRKTGTEKENENVAVSQMDQLKSLVADVEKKFGKGAVMLDDGTGSVTDVEVVPTGALPVDLALGIGGMPLGRIAEIYGPEGSGKTTLIYHVIAEAQKKGLPCAFIDAEHAVDKAYAKRIGVDFDKLLFSQPDHGEQALNIAEMVIKSGIVKAVFIDSVAALVPKAEIEGEIGDSFVGLQARLMSQAMRKLAGTASEHGALIFFTNQLREKVGVMFGSPETTPGGRALKFYSSIRMDIRKIETLKEKDEAVGQRCRIKFVKNKLAPPFKQAEFIIRWGEGVDKAGMALAYGTDDKKKVTIPKDVTFGIIAKAGGNHTFPNGHKERSGDAARQYLVDHPEVREQIDEAVRRKLAGESIDDIEWITPAEKPAEEPAEVDA